MTYYRLTLHTQTQHEEIPGEYSRGLFPTKRWTAPVELYGTKLETDGDWYVLTDGPNVNRVLKSNVAFITESDTAF